MKNTTITAIRALPSAVRAAAFTVLSLLACGEQTEAYVFAALHRTEAAIVNAAIEELLDLGAVASTVIDGGERFGFLAGLRRVA